MSDEIIASVRDVIADSEFQTEDIEQQIGIIEGKDEGLGLWITANYIAGLIGHVSGRTHYPLPRVV